MNAFKIYSLRMQHSIFNQSPKTVMIFKVMFTKSGRELCYRYYNHPSKKERSWEVKLWSSKGSTTVTSELFLFPMTMRQYSKGRDRTQVSLVLCIWCSPNVNYNCSKWQKTIIKLLLKQNTHSTVITMFPFYKRMHSITQVSLSLFLDHTPIKPNLKKRQVLYRSWKVKENNTLNSSSGLACQKDLLRSNPEQVGGVAIYLIGICETKLTTKWLLKLNGTKESISIVCKNRLQIFHKEISFKSICLYNNNHHPGNTWMGLTWWSRHGTIDLRVISSSHQA